MSIATSTPTLPHWSSRLMFIFAASGSAVGLGNIWKFPYIVGENGGGAFVLLYLACLIGLGVPLLIGEIMIGRKGGEYPARAFLRTAKEKAMSSAWGGLGALGALIALLILAFYSVVSGWVGIYAVDFGIAALGGDAARSGADAFGAMLADPVLQLIAVTIITITAGIVVYFDVTRGVQSVMRYVAPLFAVLLIVMLVLVAANTGEFGAALAYMFAPDFSALSPAAFGEALGHAFFTLSVGMCGMLIYGAYLDDGANVPRLGFAVAAIDTAIAFAAALIIFPIVFAFDLEASAGPGLLFIALPQGFGLLPSGNWLGFAFFTATFLAAFSSLIALLIIARHWIDEVTPLGGAGATLIATALTWLGGMAVTLSLNAWDHITILGLGLLDFLDETTSAWLLPASGLGMAIFASRAIVPGLGDGPVKTYLTICLRYVAPLGIVILVVSKFVDI
ncbi:sodium-dependent transporter [Pyruvatibacter sp.]|uniref:sodium-dependent transporter n=1 Tax=Pyruvatibacter sp. TaxID=1981328 RepID=UPI0032EB175C